MNIERLLSMFLRRGVRMLMTKGMNAGINRFATQDSASPSPEQKQRSRDAKQMARKAQQGAKIARRLGRF